MTGEACLPTPPWPWEPWLQTFSLQTLAVDFSGLWVLTSEAPNDPRLKGRAREVVRPLGDLAQGGQAQWSVRMFLLHFFSGINKAVSIPDVTGVFRYVTREASGPSTSSKSSCPAP